jgi:hypothetical protein
MQGSFRFHDSFRDSFRPSDFDRFRFHDSFNSGFFGPR